MSTPSELLQSLRKLPIKNLLQAIAQFTRNRAKSISSGLLQNLCKLPTKDLLQATAAAIAIFEALRHWFGW